MFQWIISSVISFFVVKIASDLIKEVKSMEWNESKSAMENMKLEVANELGITLNKDYNGNLSSKDAGHIGGNMVKKMIEAQERAMSGR